MNIKKILGYALGPIGSAAFGILSLPLISWYYPAEDIGRIVLLQTISGLTILILGLGLDQAYIREYYAAKDKASLFKSISLSPFVLTIVVILAVLVWNTAWPADLIFDLQDKTLGLLFLIFLLTSLFARFLSLILRMQEKAVAFFPQPTYTEIPDFWRWFCYFVFSGVKTDTVSLVLAYTVAQVLTVAVLTYQTRHELRAAARAPWSSETHHASLRYGLPLAFGNLAYWGLTSIDRFALKQWAGLDELGIYSMAVSFGAVALIFQSVFSTIWAPLVFKWVEDKTHLDKIGGITLSMTELISAMICFIGIFSPVVTWILPDKYAPVQFLLLSCMLYPLFYTLTEVSGIGLNVVKRTWLITAVNIVAFAINFSLLSLLVPHLGARGAAIASAISFWVFCIIKTEFSSRVWRPLPRLKIYTNTALSVLLCLSYTYFGTKENYPLFALLWLAGLSYLIWRRKSSLISAAAAVKSRLKR